MNYFITINVENKVTGVYSDESPAIPSDAIPIPEDEFLKIQNAEAFGDFTYVKGVLTFDATARLQAKAATEARVARDAKIAAIAWRYERNYREARMLLPKTDDVSELDKYVQALADVTKQSGFPSDIKWPALP